MKINDPELAKIWDQDSIPILFKRGRGYPLLVRLPGLSQKWLKGKKRRIPVWNKQLECWEVPVAWFEELIRRLIRKYRKVYIIQVYRERQVCAPACWYARGPDCECSCMGANHGQGHPGGVWYVVSSTLAIRWGRKKYACRLVSKAPDKKPAPKKRLRATKKP